MMTHPAGPIRAQSHTNGQNMLKRISIALTAIVLISWTVACGSESADTTSPSATPTATVDRYEGTWVQPALGAQQQDQMPRVLVKKVGDQYAFTDPSGEDKLVGLQTDANASGQSTILAFLLSDNTLATVDGDTLTLSTANDTFTITVDGDTMTWVFSAHDEPFTFKREATSTTESP